MWLEAVSPQLHSALVKLASWVMCGFDPKPPVLERADDFDHAHVTKFCTFICVVWLQDSLSSSSIGRMISLTFCKWMPVSSAVRAYICFLNWLCWALYKSSILNFFGDFRYICQACRQLSPYTALGCFLFKSHVLWCHSLYTSCQMR